MGHRQMIGLNWCGQKPLRQFLSQRDSIISIEWIDQTLIEVVGKLANKIRSNWPGLNSHSFFYLVLVVDDKGEYDRAMALLTRILPVTPKTDQNLIALEFDHRDRFEIKSLDLRFECPCATCVDEITGKRTLKRENLKSDVRPKSIEPVGRYAIRILWSDGHSTGMFHFDRLFEIAQKIAQKSEENSNSERPDVSSIH